MALNSTSTIKIIDLLCEGEIEGIVKGKKGIFLDETPVRSFDNKQNVSDEHFTYELRTGTKNQEQLSDYSKGGASNLINISEEVGTNYSETKNAKNKVDLSKTTGTKNKKTDTKKTDAKKTTNTEVKPKTKKQQRQKRKAKKNKEIKAKQAQRTAKLKKFLRGFGPKKNK